MPVSVNDISEITRKELGLDALNKAPSIDALFSNLAPQKLTDLESKLSNYITTHRDEAKKAEQNIDNYKPKPGTSLEQLQLERFNLGQELGGINEGISAATKDRRVVKEVLSKKSSSAPSSPVRHLPAGALRVPTSSSTSPATSSFSLLGTFSRLFHSQPQMTFSSTEQHLLDRKRKSR